MSAAIVCDQCGHLRRTINKNGESPHGEEAAWLTVTTTWTRADLCSRACAVAFIDSVEFAEQHDAELEVIAEIAREVAS